MADKTVRISVEFGSNSDVVTVRHSDRSQPMVVGLLGVETDTHQKPKIVYLRSKIHGKTAGVEYIGWQPSGAISTILTRITGDE